MVDTATSMQDLINGCISGKRKSQELLYRQFYGFGMGICIRYSNSRNEAVEVLNDGFLKVFANLKNFDSSNRFEPWLKRILVNSSIDYYRKAKKHYYHDDVSEARSLEVGTPNAVSAMNHDDLIKLVGELPRGYRVAFNLYVIEGYSHKEIAEMMEITESTSKSNLSRARGILRKQIRQEEQHGVLTEKNERRNK